MGQSLSVPSSPEVGHLVLKITVGESIRITTADGTRVVITKLSKGRLLFDAPLSAKILRGDVVDREGSR